MKFTKEGRDCCLPTISLRRSNSESYLASFPVNSIINPYIYGLHFHIILHRCIKRNFIVNRPFPGGGNPSYIADQLRQVFQLMIIKTPELKAEAGNFEAFLMSEVVR